MKMISFGTQSHETGHDYDLNIFFELTNSDYKKLIKNKFRDVWEMYHYCEMVSVGMYNKKVFCERDDLSLNGSVFNHNDQNFITPEFSYN